MPSRLQRMHTAEHILTAVMSQEYGAPRNVEMHLGEKKTKCDYAPQQEVLQDQDIARIEKLVNQEIQKNHNVSSHFLDRRSAEQKFDLWKVPEDTPEIRIVSIGDFDATPCVGQHVAATGDIGSFRIISYEHRDNGNLRIRFKILDN